MSIEQVARLLGLDPKKNGVRFALERIEHLGYIRREEIHIDDLRQQTVVRLTSDGARRAADSLGRTVGDRYRDDVHFYSHLLLGGDLYISVVCDGANDWLTSRERAARFTWMSSNEDTQFYWEALKEFASGRKRYRRVVPDITIETDSRRFLVEIEKATKTQGVVASKLDAYSDLFSPMKSAGDRPAYQLKYGDSKDAVVLFVFQTSERAANARAYVERRRLDRSFYIPSCRCGTIAELSAGLRADIFGERTSAGAPAAGFAGDNVALMKRFVRECAEAIVGVQKAIDGKATLERPRLPATFKAVVEMLKQAESGNGR